MHEIVHKIWILISSFCHIISNSKQWARGGYFQLFQIIELSVRSGNSGARMGCYGIRGHQMHNCE
jgi:hypothetical protein